MQSNTMKNPFYKSLLVKQITFTLTFLTLFIGVVTLAIYEGNKKSITLSVNGEQEELKTHASSVGEVLSENDIDISSRDLVSPSLDASVEEGLTIEWEQAKEVAITVEEEQTSLWTTKNKVKDILAEANIELTEYDEVSPALTSNLEDENEIFVDKAYEFVLIDGGEEKEYWSTSTTVGDFLNKEAIELNEFDRLENKIDAEIKPGAVVEIVRVEKENTTVEEEEKFSIEKKSDKSLLKGREKVVQEGKKGIVERAYEIVKENGKEVSRSLISEKTVKESKNQVVAVGTKVVVASAGNTTNTTVSRNNSEPAGGKEFYVTATAYTAGCNGCSGITATGINLNANRHLKVIAVDPRVIPLGSKVWVEGYGHAVAGDTGGAIKGNKIDLHVPTKQEAYNFGRRQVKIKVLN